LTKARPRKQPGGSHPAILLDVRLTPKAALDRIDGVSSSPGGRWLMLARVRAVPERGRANQALEALLAAAFDVPASRVSVVSGKSSRLKTVSVEADPGAVDAALSNLPRR
jgi:uncharacterized protein YggU (UPF0235/DUF167 family)